MLQNDKLRVRKTPIEQVKRHMIDNAELDQLHSPSDDPCNCFYLRRAARLITRQYGETMKPAGLKSGQFSILACLSHHDSLTITELAKMMSLERTSLSRALRPMEKDNLISLSPAEYQRRRYVTLTAQGQAAYEQALPYWNKAQKEFAEQLGPEDIALLRKLLKRTADVITK